MMPGETILSGAPKTSLVSDFKVMKSGGGYYIGTTTSEEGFEEPYTRETGYFATHEEAKVALDTYMTTGYLPKQRR